MTDTAGLRISAYQQSARAGFSFYAILRHKLKQRRQQTDKRLPKAIYERTLLAYHTLRYKDTTLYVFHEDLPEAQCRVAVIDKGIGLEVVFKTAEVYIRRTACAYSIVTDKELGVEKSRAVQINLDTGLYRLENV